MIVLLSGLGCLALLAAALAFATRKLEGPPATEDEPKEKPEPRRKFVIETPESIQPLPLPVARAIHDSESLIRNGLNLDREAVVGAVEVSARRFYSFLRQAPPPDLRELISRSI